MANVFYRKSHFIFVVKEFYNNRSFLVAEEYHLEVGCHRRDVEILPVVLYLIDIGHLGSTAFDTHQGKQADEVRVVSETECRTFVTAFYCLVGFLADVAQKRLGCFERDTFCHRRSRIADVHAVVDGEPDVV